MPLLSLRLANPAHVIDINRIPGLDRIDVVDGQLRIGALVRQAVAEGSPTVAGHCRVLAEALSLVAHAAIRNRGTVCGSLAHSDPAAEVPLLFSALKGEIVVRSVRGERVIGADRFFIGYLSTAIAPDELLVELRLPIDRPRIGRAFAEVSRRHGDFATVAVAAEVRLDEAGLIERGAIRFGGVGASPVALGVDDQLLTGLGPADAVEAACAAVRSDLHPVGDVHGSTEYRRFVAEGLVRSLIPQAVARAQEAAEEGTS
jgi:CO/xanthine dehydrogenase FAD-binding subunit